MSVDLVVVDQESLRKVIREELQAWGGRGVRAFADDDLVTYEEAASEQLANCSRSTIGNWVRTGRLPAYGKYKLRRVRVGDVRRVLAGEGPTCSRPDEEAARIHVAEILDSISRKSR